MPTAKIKSAKSQGLQKVTASRRHTSARSVKKELFITVPARLAIVSLAGFLLVFVSSWWLLYSQTVLSFKAAPIVVANAELRGATPINVSIADVQIDLQVTPTAIIDGIWQVPDGSAAYLESSARPKEDGNIVIYAHNKKSLFGPLRTVKVGATVDLTADDGATYSYTVTEIRVVKPENVGEVLPTDHEVLTLYTCTGLFDSLRLVIKAYPSQLASL